MAQDADNYNYLKTTNNGICLRCGNDLDTAGVCWNCIHKKFSEEHPTNTPMIPYQYGWICPKCGSVFAPHISQCPNCSIVTPITVTCNV